MNPTYLPGPDQPDFPVRTGIQQAVGGFAIGILVLDLRYPLFPGNVANASTWDFPVLFKILRGAGKEILDGDRSLVEKIVAGGRELEEQGVRHLVQEDRLQVGLLDIDRKDPDPQSVGGVEQPRQNPVTVVHQDGYQTVSADHVGDTRHLAPGL